MSLWLGTCDRETRPRTMPLPLLSTSKLPLQVLHQNANFCEAPVHRESKQMPWIIYNDPWVMTLKPGQLEVPSREQSWSNDPSSEAYPCGSVPVHLAVLCIWAHVIDQNKSLLNLKHDPTGVSICFARLSQLAPFPWILHEYSERWIWNNDSDCAVPLYKVSFRFTCAISA